MGIGDLFNKKKQVEPCSNDDAVISVIDELYSKAEYEKIIQKTEEISADKWSNEFWFRRIDALNKLSRFKEAKKELSLLSKRCSDPKEDARLFYSLGYIFDHTDCELKAVECFYKAREFDPEIEGLLDAIDDSMKRADQCLDEAVSILGNLFSDTSEAIGNAGEQNKLDENNAFSYISMIQASFIPYGIGIEIPLDKLFFKCDDADKPRMRSLLKDRYGITDIGSLQQWFGDNRIAPELDSIKSAVERKLEPPFEKMSPSERIHVKADMMVIQHFGELIPEAGITAWDYCSVLALARMAFSCDLLSNTEFMQTALFFTDACKDQFTSWDEFTRSVVIGGFYNTMCFDTQYDIRAAALFGKTAGSMCKKNYSKVTWIE